MKSLTLKTIAVFATLALAAAAPAQPRNDLPPFVKRGSSRGTIRICGDTQGGLLNLLEDAFVKIYPNVAFENRPAPSQEAVPAMVLGLADLGLGGAPTEPSQLYLLDKLGGRRAAEISIAGGSYDVRGRSAVLAIYVHRTNPIERITVRQLEGIFGEQRNAGWKDFQWDPAHARGPDGNLRTWGQLGLTGEWANRPITTYGLSWGGPDIFMARLLTGDSARWNPNYRTYNIEGFARGKALVAQMNTDMAADPACIGWSQMIFAGGNPDLKAIPVAWDEHGPFLLPSKESLANRTYPLNRDIYLYARVPLDRTESEFVRFILSAEGQRIVAEHGIYNPLTPDALAEQLKKLEP